jgi:hypothetical protein
MGPFLIGWTMSFCQTITHFGAKVPLLLVDFLQWPPLLLVFADSGSLDFHGYLLLRFSQFVLRNASPIRPLLQVLAEVSLAKTPYFREAME